MYDSRQNNQNLGEAFFPIEVSEVDIFKRSKSMLIFFLKPNSNNLLNNQNFPVERYSSPLQIHKEEIPIKSLTVGQS